uniref:Acyltransferase n=1 Tax=Meloidogyne incognita TaxID=6306 RepID=A0A914LJ44_MELIC
MKRADIQGLRTVAILAVIFFHIWPTYFPSGFLGVDIYAAQTFRSSAPSERQLGD